MMLDRALGLKEAGGFVDVDVEPSGLKLGVGHRWSVSNGTMGLGIYGQRHWDGDYTTGAAFKYTF